MNALCGGHEARGLDRQAEERIGVRKRGRPPWPDARRRGDLSGPGRCRPPRPGRPARTARPRRVAQAGSRGRARRPDRRRVEEHAGPRVVQDQVVQDEQSRHGGPGARTGTLVEAVAHLVDGHVVGVLAMGGQEPARGPHPHAREAARLHRCLRVEHVDRVPRRQEAEHVDAVVRDAGSARGAAGGTRGAASAAGDERVLERAVEQPVEPLTFSFSAAAALSGRPSVGMGERRDEGRPASAARRARP